MSKKNVLVIGGTSFIGIYAINAMLDKGWKVTATGLSNRFENFFKQKNIPFVKLDISKKSDFDTIPKEQYDACILMAALLPANDTADLVSDDHAEKYVDVNINGTLNTIKYCCKNNITQIISATSYADVFNHWSKDNAITEETPRDFVMHGDHCEYVITKNAATDFLLYFNEQYGMKNAIFRFPPVYGVGPHGTLMENGKVRKSGIQIFIDKAKANEDIDIYGDKEACRDIVYVKDVAQAFIDIISSKDAKGLYNISSGKSVSLEDQAKAIVKVFSQKSKILYSPDKANNIRSYCMSIKKASDEFGYSPKYSNFEDMMRDWKHEEELGVYTKLFGTNNDSDTNR